MKKYIIITLCIITGHLGWSQHDSTSSASKKSDYEIKTLFGNGKTSHGGFGAIMVNYSQFDGKDALLIGGRGGWILNHGFSIGLGGYGLTTNTFLDEVIVDKKVQLEAGYGGLYLEAIVGSKWPIHLSFPVLLGVGGAAYTSKSDDSNDPWDYSVVEDTDGFVVVEPGVNLELNITKFFRLGLGVNYRYIYGLDLIGTASDGLDGLSGGLTFKFGKF